MTFARANALGWTTNEVLTSSQANTIDLNQSRAVDGYAGGVYSPSTTLEWREGLIVDATYSAQTNRIGLVVEGKGTGAAIEALAGDSATYAIIATGVGATNTGAGRFTAIGTGIGVNASSDTGEAVYGLTGGSIGTYAIHGKSIFSADAVYGDSSTGTGYGVVAEGKPATPTKASLRIVPQNDDPSSPDDGATWIMGKDSKQRADGVTHVMNSTKAWASAESTTAPTGGIIVHEQHNILEDTGAHDGGDGQTSMTDSSAAFTPSGLIDFVIKNVTDDSWGIITANTATNVTATLDHGTNDDWDDDDVYVITHSEIVSDRARFHLDNQLATATTSLGYANSAQTAPSVAFEAATPVTYFDIDIRQISDGAQITLSTIPKFFNATIMGELD